MLKIALCDDDLNQLHKISNWIDCFKQSKCHQYEIKHTLFSHGDQLLTAINGGDLFDIIFLDVLMPMINGIDVAKEIRLSDKNVRIIFLTSSAQFALDSYDVNAFSYLMKHATQEKFCSVLESALAEIQDCASQQILIKSKNGLIALPFHNVEFIEVKGKTLSFYLASGDKHDVFGSLSEYETPFLVQARFIKPHRSYIVNLDYVRRLKEGEITTVGSHMIPVSKANYPEVKQRYIALAFREEVSYG